MSVINRSGGPGMNIMMGCMLVFFNILFAGFCLWGVYAAYYSYSLEQVGVKTNGTVVSLDWHSDSDGGSTAKPVVEFPANGKTYSFTGGSASNPPQYSIGQSVEVIYDPQNPDKAQINTFFERWLMPVVLIPAMIGGALIMNLALIFGMKLTKMFREQRQNVIGMGPLT